jgi:hypothetical protein
MTVYLVSDGVYLKIGFSAHSIDKRIRAPQTGNPRDITLVQYVPRASMEVERSLHRRFAHYRVRASGEWFQDAQEIRVEFERLRAAAEAAYREEVQRNAHIATHPGRAILNWGITRGALAVAGAGALYSWTDLGWDIAAGVALCYYLPAYYFWAREVRQLARNADMHVAAAETILGPNWAGGRHDESGK